MKQRSLRQQIDHARSTWSSLVCLQDFTFIAGSSATVRIVQTNKVMSPDIKYLYLTVYSYTRSPSSVCSGISSC